MSRFKVVITDYDYGDIDVERGILEKVGARVVGLQAKSEADLAVEARDCDAIMNQYVKTIETTRDINQADNYLYGSLDDRQKGFFSEIKSSFEFTKFIANRSALPIAPPVNELIPQAADTNPNDTNR